jgi:hypothetical protein
VDRLHKRNFILLHYESTAGRVRGAEGWIERRFRKEACLIRYSLCCITIFLQNNPPTWHLDPLTPCAMLRQMFRPSLRPLSRSFPPRKQLPTRGLHHTHSSKHRHDPHSTSHICCRRVCIPIQTSPALLQLGPSSQSKRHSPYILSYSFHSSTRVQSVHLTLIGLFSTLKVCPQL